MSSPIVILTAVESGFGFLLTSVILVLVLRHGRQVYHYLFAAFLLICAIWDMGVFLLMVRNDQFEELVVIGKIIGFWCIFLPALLFHFASLYAGRPVKWAIVLVWLGCGIFWLLGLAGFYWKIGGVYQYNWGNIFKVVPTPLDPFGMVAWFGICLSACWLLYKASKTAETALQRRHYRYVTLGFLVITLAIVKVGVVMGINIPILLPLGMFLVDVFNAIIGVAIVKDRLFDITVIVKKGTLYSILAGVLIFVYSLTEHVIITYIGELIGEQSNWLHFISIAVAIAVLMPVKKRTEAALEGFFAQRKLEF